MQRGKGWFVNNYDVIYVQGTVDGEFYRKSTRKKNTANNLKWINKNHRDVLLKIIAKEKEAEGNTKTKDSNYFIDFGLEVIELSSYERNEQGQKDLLGKLNNHIKPYFKNFKLSDLKPLDIDRWQVQLLETHSTGTVKKCRDLISKIMQTAVDNDLVPKNPCNTAKKISVVHEKTVCYTEDEVKKIIENSDGWFKIFLLIAFSTGLRVGEIMALKWQDIKFEENYIYLNRSITKGVITEAKDTRETQRGKIKNHERYVDLIPDVVKVLENYYLDRKHDEWLFVNKYGDHFAESKSIVKYHFKPLLEKINVPYKQLKATRHSFISMMVNNGFEKVWVKEQVGHTQGSTVLDKHYFTYQRDSKRLTAVNNFFNFSKAKKKVLKNA